MNIEQKHYQAFIEGAYSFGMLIEAAYLGFADSVKPCWGVFNGGAFDWKNYAYRLTPGQVVKDSGGEIPIPLGQKALESLPCTLEQAGPVKTYRDELAEGVQCNFNEIDLREWADGRVDDLDVALLSSRNKMIVRQAIATIEAAYRYSVADAILAERDRVKP